MSGETRDCLVCGTACDSAIDLPALPLTDSYGTKPANVPGAGIDQEFLLCPECGHGRLATLLPAEVLYSGDYSFRTSTSHTSSAGCEFFLSFLDRVAAGRSFECALDVGCNDLHLLDRLRGRARHLVGIDPVWAGREAEHTDPAIIVSGAMFEVADLNRLLPAAPDLIVARHTMEHILQPVATVKRMLAHAAPDALLVIEVPGLDVLVRRSRYDQIFHQHVQYFSRRSLMRLIEETGGEFVAMAENYHHWGAALVAFRRRSGAAQAVPPAGPKIDQVRAGYAAFRQELAGVVPLLERLGGPFCGYGAAQMLAVLGYHMSTDFSFLQAIVDDDPAKDGIKYWNVPAVQVQTMRDLNLSEATVLITAVDNMAPIMRRLLQQRPKHIVSPIRVI